MFLDITKTALTHEKGPDYNRTDTILLIFLHLSPVKKCHLHVMILIAKLWLLECSQQLLIRYGHITTITQSA